MTVEQFSILAMLAKEGMKFRFNDAIELADQDFADALTSLAWDTSAPPFSITPGLVAQYDSVDYRFDLYKFDGFRLNVYYSLNMRPTLFIIFGAVGEFVILRRWE